MPYIPAYQLWLLAWVQARFSTTPARKDWDFCRRSQWLYHAALPMSKAEPDRVEEQWLRDGRAMPLPIALSHQFDDYLNRLPWVGASLDWSKMPPSTTFNVVGKRRYDLRSWIGGTRIGRHAHTVVWYERARGGVIVPLEFAVANFDALYRLAPGVRFAFGVDVSEDQIQPAFGDLLQYGSGDELIAVC